MPVRRPASPRPSRWLFAVVPLLTSGCDALFVAPQLREDPAVQLSLEIETTSATSVADGTVDRVQLHIRRPGGQVRDTAVGVQPDAEPLRARFLLHPPEMVAGLRLDVTLYHASDRLYAGATEIDARGPGPATSVVEVSPLIASVTVGTPSLAFDALTDTYQLSAAARFQNGSAIPDVVPVWSSDAPDIASVTADGLVTALANGRAVITARVGDLSASVSVEVRQKLASIFAIFPPSPTIEAGESLQLLAEGADRLGFRIVGPVEATWVSTNGNLLVVTRRGRALGLAPGVATVSVSLGDASRSVPVTVTTRTGADARPIASADDRKITRWDLSGSAQQIATTSVSDARMLTWTPGHDRVAFVQSDRLFGWTTAQGLHVIDIGTLVAVAWPEYSADGGWIFFEARPSATTPTTIFRVRPDGSGLERWPTAEDDAHMPTASPDGTSVAYVVGTDLRVAPRGAPPYTLFSFDPGTRTLYTPTWSPDGSRIALTYSSRRGVAVVDMDGSATFPIGAHGLWEGLSWSPDGAWILGAESRATLMSPDTGESFDLPWTLPRSGVAWWR